MFYYQSSYQQNYIRQRLISNVGSAWQLVMAGDIENGVFDLFGEGMDSVSIQRKIWGMFQIAEVKAFRNTSIRMYEVSKTGMVGKRLDKWSKSAIYVQDNLKPIAVCGNTQIKGDAYRPAKGIIKGVVDGRGYLGSQLVYGNQFTSTHSLPPLDSMHIRNLMDQLNQKGPSLPASIDSFSQSFLDSTLIFRQSVIDLSSGYFQGNIMLMADSFLRVGANCYLEDVILMAPTILIESGFEGQAQFFGSQRILVMEGVKLVYPSVLGLLPTGLEGQIPLLELREGVIVTGSLFSYQGKKAINRPKIIIDRGCQINGQIYSDGPIEAGGEIYGNIICQQFSLRIGGRSYYNHVLDLLIAPDKRSPHYVAPMLMADAKKQNIVKWLD